MILEPDIASVELRRGANADGAITVARPLDKLIGIVQTCQKVLELILSCFNWVLLGLVRHSKLFDMIHAPVDELISVLPTLSAILVLDTQELVLALFCTWEFDVNVDVLPRG